MDCRFDRKTLSLLRYVKRHNGEHEQMIIDYFDDPLTRKRLSKLRKEGCLQQNDILSVPVGVKGEPASLIGRQWSITDKGRGCLHDSLKGNVAIFCPIAGLSLALLTFCLTALGVF